MTAGRKVKTHTAPDGTRIPGLMKCTDGRWRVLVNGKETRFTEADEFKACERAKTMLGFDGVKTTTIGITVGDVLPDLHDTSDPEAVRLTQRQTNTLAAIHDVLADPNIDADESNAETVRDLPIGLHIPDAILFPWLAQQLATNAREIGRKVGILDLEARFRGASLPVAAVTLRKIIDHYKAENKSKPRVKAATLSEFQKLMDYTHARALDDLTKETLRSIHAHVEASGLMGSTKEYCFRKVKSVIGFGMKEFDTLRIRACLDRCSVLKNRR